MKIISCNIRYAVADDGDDHWKLRKGFCADVIRHQEPDIVCFQELMAEQWRFMENALPEFDKFGMIDEPNGDNPTNAIFYRREAFERVSAGGYWLSQTPHVAGSISWDSNCIRLANWLRLIETRSGTEFRVINTHLDHRSQPARENQARMLVEDACAYRDDYPQLLTGDMNCDATNAAIATFKTGGFFDTYGQVHGTEDPGHTHHYFRGPAHASDAGKIDWVFARGNVTVEDAKIIDDHRDGQYPSDHYFISATVTFQTSHDSGH